MTTYEHKKVKKQIVVWKAHTGDEILWRVKPSKAGSYYKLYSENYPELNPKTGRYGDGSRILRREVWRKGKVLEFDTNKMEILTDANSYITLYRDFHEIKVTSTLVENKSKKSVVKKQEIAEQREAEGDY